MGILKKILFSIFLIANVEARPISYSGGSTMMAMSDDMKETIYYHYSPTYKYSVGIESCLSETYLFVEQKEHEKLATKLVFSVSYFARRFK